MRRLILFLCAVLAGCGGNVARRGPLGPSFTPWISSDAVAVAGIRMDSVRTTPLYRKLSAQKRWPNLGEFSVDDVHDLLVTSDGNNVMAVARGNFQGKRPGFETLPYKGYTIYVKDEHAAVVFLDDHTALGGAPAVLRASLDRQLQHPDAAPRDLIARAQALPSDAQIWAAVSGWTGAGADRLREMGDAANLDRMLRAVEGASLTVDLRAGIHLAATGDCRTEADAKTLSDSLRGLAGIARLGVPKNRPELARAFDGIQVRQEGRLVRVHIDLAEDLAEQVLQ